MSTTIPGAFVDTVLPKHDARTVQAIAVDAEPAVVYEAIWQADLLSSVLARTLMTVARVPETIVAARRGERAPGGDRHWRLAEATGDDSPWILLGDRPGLEVVLGLLWTPPAGGTTCPPEEFSEFWRSGVARVAWSLAVVPYGRSSVLVMETRTLALDDVARRRFRAAWPVMGPPAALARRGMLRAIAREAERRPRR